MDEITGTQQPRNIKGLVLALTLAIVTPVLGFLASNLIEANETVACSEQGRAEASQYGGASMLLEKVLWGWYCEKKRAAERIEAQKGETRAQPAASSTLPPTAQAEPEKFPAAVPAPPPAVENKVAVATPAPAAPTAPSSLACGDGQIPDAPQLAVTWQQQMCALIACGGGTEAISDELVFVRDWGALAGSYAGKACMTAARQTLASQKLVNSLYDAIDRSGLPERDPSRTVCRRIRVAMGDSIKARQEKLAKISTSGCSPADALSIPAELRTFTETHGVAVAIPE